MKGCDWMLKMSYLWMTALMVLMGVYWNEGEVVPVNTYYEWMVDLQSQYPEWIELEEIGRSVDKRPIYGMRMTDSKVEDEKMHFVIEAGTHAREVSNPLYVMKMVELYLKDVISPVVIPEYDLSGLLKEAVIHVLPLTNPDGYALARDGLASVQTSSARQALSMIKDTNYERFKSNIRGVDLNRNYPATYMNLNTFQLVNIFNYPYRLQSDVPSSQFYAGPYPASEPETQSVINYLERYPMRGLMSFHSQGNLVIWDVWPLSTTYNQYVQGVGAELARVANFELNEMKVSSSGYITDYFSMKTLKPSYTIETGRNYVHPSYSDMFQRIKLLPLIAFKKELDRGYAPYRVYVNHQYVNDYWEKSYATAYARLWGGIVVEEDGLPRQNLLRYENEARILQEHDLLLGDVKGLRLYDTLTRSEGMVLIHRLLEADGYLESSIEEEPNEEEPIKEEPIEEEPIEEEPSIAESPFEDVPDWAKEAVDIAYLRGITKGISSTQFGSDKRVSANEFATLLLRAYGYDEMYYSVETSLDFLVQIKRITKDEAQILKNEVFRRDHSALLVSRFAKNIEESIAE